MIRSSLLTRHYNNNVICEAQTHHYYCRRDKNKSKSPNVRRYRIITEI